jgi:hypothetical protein
MSYYNLAFEFVKNGSTQEIRIAPEIEFFGNTTSATITDARVKRLFTTPLQFSSLTYSQQNQDATLTYYQQASFVNQQCADNAITLSSPFNVPVGILPNNGVDATVDRLYIAEAVPSTTNIAAYQSTYNNGGTITNGGVYYALSVANVLTARAYRNRAPLGLIYEGFTIPNPETIKIARMIMLKAPLTVTELNAIEANRKGVILVNGEQAWIQNLKYDIETGMTDFELLTQ